MQPTPFQAVTDFVAHARLRADGSFAVHAVEEHAREVARRAAAFAEAFGGGAWARVAGLWHDLGKYHPEFQQYIRRATGYDAEAHLEGQPGRVDHSTLGAAYAVEQMKVPGRMLAYLIAGHHTGLPDWDSAEEANAALFPRLERNRSRLPHVLAQAIPPDLLNPPAPGSRPPGGREGIALWIRMLFSCLVDADFLDTEAFLNEGQAALRGTYPTLAELRTRFDLRMEAKADELKKSGPVSELNRIRDEVLVRCRGQAAQAPGLFSLTVPTGGGKTLSSLAFALDHALTHGKRRVIYVIPYTSIIEQTADVFRVMLAGAEGELDPVVEHHSNLDSDRETPYSRVASENWDAPIIVTTSVQFWESLFAARTSRCRKLHNIVDSVVVLDEVQMLPAEFLKPITATAQLLADHYGVTLVLCTATQPALEEQHTLDFDFPGLRGVREIVADTEALHHRLRRVVVRVPADLTTVTTLDALATRLTAHARVLCVVNRRDDARDLFRLLPHDTAIHLSGLMCGEHRSHTIREIRRALHDGEMVRVVSTQLVESGVDLDFPVVYRALAGLDSVAQAAGRCNREGSLRDRNGAPIPGEVVVFVPPRPAPVGALRMAAEAGRRMFEQDSDDPLAPERFRGYFCELFWKHGDRLDAKSIIAHLTPDARGSIRFRTAAREFRLIEDNQLPVVVRYTPTQNEDHRSSFDINSVLEGLRFTPPDRQMFRRLQRFTVTVPRYHHDRLRAQGHIEELHPGIWVQVTSDLYDQRLGLQVGEDAQTSLTTTLEQPV
ncbi:CRISPR-associated endonuclease Cas3'' [Piscinibacter sp.]|uniref:CRISPR-associated endonuclease Cas3'' n=1 Tax=Piscinibacter sp. TaxID=1903157 RepID=UPI002C6969B9|nr:CRISPR-associated endonuclease Cas3'' [Albitalea sp.]HUG26112.1 CRISPR-associated endonuclease Cas3'' [Albitalea sp.]